MGKRLFLLCFVLISGFITIAASLRFLHKVGPEAGKPLYINPILPTGTDALGEEKTVKPASFSDVVERALSGTKGTYAVSIIDLTTGEEYHRNEKRKFEAGSLYKLWVMATVFEQIEDGKLNDTTVLTQNIPTLNEKFHIEPELAERKSGMISLSVADALNQMITYSDNYAALLLSERIRLSTVKTFLSSNGFKESSLGEPPRTTSADIAIFLRKLHQGILVSSEASKEMLELMKHQQLRNKLAKYLPNEVVIAHKTGEIGAFTHDAGIVYTSKSDYIIVVLSESTYPKGAEARIATLSKDVYDFISK